MWARKLFKLGRFSNDYVFLDKRPLRGIDTFFLLKYPNYSFAARKAAAVKPDINDNIITENIHLAASVVNDCSFDLTAFTVIFPMTTEISSVFFLVRSVKQ